MAERRRRSWVKWILSALLLISVILNIVLLCLPSNSSEEPTCETPSIWKYDHSDHGSIFADLSKDEHQQVRKYMWAQKGFGTWQTDKAQINVNYIFMIELDLPKKADALHYLDSNGDKPPRQASVVVIHGSKHVKEYVVGPLGGQLTHRDVTEERYNKSVIPINARPITDGEYNKIFALIGREVVQKLGRLLSESFDCCTNTLFSPFESLPRGVKSGDRETWFSFFQDQSRMYIQPVGFEVLIDHKNTDPKQWHLKKLFYNGKYFSSPEELRESYDNGSVPKIVYKDIPNYGSLKPRSRPIGLGPQQTYPQGKRYSVKGNQVMYMDWSFAFGLSVLTGMKAFDIRFKGERIAYELSVQEAMSVYGSATPGMMLTKFVDASSGIGRFAYELVRGVDCPYEATYVDTQRYINMYKSKLYRNSICIFEHDIGRPLRRHFSDFYQVKYGGLANSALIMRTITAIGNYDYVWDFIFYQSGAVEARAHATGYIASSYLIDGALKYGHRVSENTLGNIHTHFLNFKVDLDILGVKNVFQTKDMVFEEVPLPWMPGRMAKVPRLVEKQLSTEKEAALRHDGHVPRYLHVASNQTNRWGHPRSYRLQVVSAPGDHLPESEPEERSISWARYKVAITKHKDLEQTSTGLYNQGDMWSPPVDFSKYIEDDESIVDEDLVAWVTAGFLHIPHAEDIPNTVTIGNGGGVIIRPHNYFDEDPSIHSLDGVYFEPGSETSCDYNRVACLKDDWCPSIPETFNYQGFDLE